MRTGNKMETLLHKVFSEKQPIRQKMTRKMMWGIYYNNLQSALESVSECKETLYLGNKILLTKIGTPDVSTELKLRDVDIDNLFNALGRVAAYNAAIDDYEN